LAPAARDNRLKITHVDRLLLFRGNKAKPFAKSPDLDRLSTEMGETADTVNRWMMELAKRCFMVRTVGLFLADNGSSR
jgi:hypothetical protein